MTVDKIKKRISDIDCLKKQLSRIGIYSALAINAFQFSACSNQDISDVAPPLSDSIMVQIIVELHLAEAKVELLKEDQLNFRDSILTHYKVSLEEFEANMAFYRENPDAYHKIYSTALDKMSDERFLSPDK